MASTSASPHRAARRWTPSGGRGSRPGYRDDGAPGTRTVYGPDYYGGFLLDPDGHNVALANHNSSAA